MGELVCYTCRESYSLDDPRWRCECGSILDIVFEPVFALDKISGRGPTMWRYREAIPITHDRNIVSFDEGFTRLLKSGSTTIPC